MFALLLGGLAGPDASLSATAGWQREVAGRRGSQQFAVAFRGLELESAPKVFPVRLPAAQYDELKRWSEAHNMPMAAVVRGLVERFLASQ